MGAIHFLNLFREICPKNVGYKYVVSYRATPSRISHPWLNPPPLQPNGCNPLNVSQAHFADNGMIYAFNKIINPDAA